MKRRLGVVANCIVGGDGTQNLKRIKDNGFEAFFASQEQYTRPVVSALKEQAEKLGLYFDFIHGPFFGLNGLWSAEETPPLIAQIRESIDAADEARVKTVVVHASSGWTPPPVSDRGLQRFDGLVEYAEKKNVILAFENLRKLGNLACLLDRYENNAHVRFCYDCGHAHCFTMNVPFLDFYGDKLVCTHIHDNHGVRGEDEHLLPFDGNIDYAPVIRGFDRAGFAGTLMLETTNERYGDMTPDEFLKTAYERIERISKL